MAKEIVKSLICVGEIQEAIIFLTLEGSCDPVPELIRCHIIRFNRTQCNLIEYISLPHLWMRCFMRLKPALNRPCQRSMHLVRNNHITRFLDLPLMLRQEVEGITSESICESFVEEYARMTHDS